ncbi:MAG: CHC2 zinc finger domain-containing protein [Thiolinea sp.]
MSGRIPRDFIDQLLTRIDIVDVINSRVPLKKAGREYTACCPFHNEKTPSFTVSPGKQFYHCFGCGAHGSAISFLMEYEHLEYVEAIETLSANLGLEVPRETNGPGAPRPRKKDRSLYELMEASAQHYQGELGKSAVASAYIRERGLSAGWFSSLVSVMPRMSGIVWPGCSGRTTGRTSCWLPDCKFRQRMAGCMTGFVGG